MLVDNAGRLRFWDFAMRNKEEKLKLARLVVEYATIGNQQIMQTGTESDSIESGVVGEKAQNKA